MAAPTEASPTPVSTTAGDIPPLPENATPEQKDAHWFKHVYQGDKMPQLTLRAVVMGGLLGMLMCSANLYTTLKIGWAFGVAITACVMSFVIWNGVAFMAGRILGRILAPLAAVGIIALAWLKVGPGLGAMLTEQGVGSPWPEVARYGTALVLTLMGAGLGLLLWKQQSKMSVLENNCMQSTASAAGYSTGSTIATMFGALLLLAKPPEGGTSADVKTSAVQPWMVVTLFTFCTGLMGVFLAIPMKRQMINHEQLPFPSGIAAAETLKSLYSKSLEAVHKAYSLVIALAVGAFVGILNTGEGTLNVLDKVFGSEEKNIKGPLHALRLPEQLPGHGFATVTPETGRLNWFWSYMDKNLAVGKETLVGKQLIQFGFEPSVLLIAAGMIVGLRVSLTMLAGSILLYFFVAPWIISMDAPHMVDGVFPKDFHASMELIGGGTTFHVYRWALWAGTALMVVSSLTQLAFSWKTFARALTKKRGAAGDSTSLEHIEVPVWWMIAGMLPLTVAMVILQVVAFDIYWWAGMLAVAMSFVLSLVACRATGETDTTPIGAMGKVMQITFALIHPGQVVPNLASAGIAANSASSSADLLTDLKSGYLLGANPRRQFLAQFFGVFFGTVAIIPVWYLMVPNKAVLESYPAPGTQSWFRIAQVLTQGLSSLAPSAKVALVVGGTLGVILPFVEKFLVPAKWKPFWPSTMGLGLSWVVGFNNSLAFALGSVITWVWGRFISKKTCDVFNVPVASGLVAGESLIKALIAMLATASGIFKWDL
ncbi:MAG: OPT family oligopeptide transporter [Phycisphaerales bacterium]